MADASMLGAADLVRVAFALLWLVLPGVAIAGRVARDRPLGERLALATACGLSVALAASMIVSLLGAGFDVLYVALWISAGAGAALLTRASRGRRPAGPGGTAGGPVDRWVLGAAVVAFAAGVATSRPIGVATDAPDHLATARAIAERGTIEPNTVFYEAGDGATPDARKGPGHALLAAIARTAGLDPVRTWYALAPFGLSAALLAFAMLARALLGGGIALAVALAAFPLVVHGESLWFLDTFLYPHNLDWLVIWPALALAVHEIEAPARWRRATSVLLAAPLAALHVFAPVLLIAGVACIGAGCAIFADRDRRAGALAIAGLIAGAALPLLVLRLLQTYHPVNPLHIEASEILYITSFLSLHSPPPMLRRFAAAALGIAVLGLLLVRRRADVRRASLLGLTLGPMFVSLNPVAGGLLIPKIGYLFVRFLGLVPFPAVAAALIGEAWRSRWWRVAAAALALVLLAGRVPVVVGFVADPPRGPTPESWRDGFALVAAHVPPGGTVLSDPLTSYSLPAYTGRRVVTALDQHSSPSDSTILVRMEAAVRALSPYRPIEEALDACGRYGADAVLVNPYHGGRIETFFDVRTPALADAARERFARSGAFRLLGERNGFTLFAPVDGAEPETAAAPRPVPGRRAEAEGSVLEDSAVELDASVALVDLTFAPDTLAPGDTLRVVAVLRKRGVDPPASAYRMVFRLRGELWGEHARFAPVERLYARLTRETGGPRLEVALNRRPLDGLYPFGLWDAGTTVADTFHVALPPDLEPGTYRAGFRMKAQRLIRNIALADLLRPTGGIGWPVGEVTVRPR